MRSARRRSPFHHWRPEPLERRRLLDGGGVPPGMDLAQANWFYQNVFLPPANVAPQWNGNVATGDAGTLGADYLAAIVARVNAYRWMAGLPGGITLDPTENAEAQQDAPGDGCEWPAQSLPAVDLDRLHGREAPMRQGTPTSTWGLPGTKRNRRLYD